MGTYPESSDALWFGSLLPEVPWANRRGSSARERQNLLAVTQVLAGLRYNERGLFQLLGSRDGMIDPGILQELNALWMRIEACEAAREARRCAIVICLDARFGAQAEELAAQLKTIADDARLRELIKLAAVCPDLQSFRKELSA